MIYYLATVFLWGQVRQNRNTLKLWSYIHGCNIGCLETVYLFTVLWPAIEVLIILWADVTPASCHCSRSLLLILIVLISKLTTNVSLWWLISACFIHFLLVKFYYILSASAAVQRDSWIWRVLDLKTLINWQYKVHVQSLRLGLASCVVLRSGTGGSMNGKQQQTEWGQQDWKQQPGCLDFDPALDTTLLCWHTTALALGHPHHAPPSPPGNHVWLWHSLSYIICIHTHKNGNIIMNK